MKIVVLDGDPAFGSGPASCGELDWAALKSLGEVTVYSGTSPQQTLARAKGAEVLLTNKVVLGATEFAALPELKLVSVLATGVNVVDLESATEHGITVCNVPGYSTASTAQHAFALLLELSNHVGIHGQDVRAGGWENASAFSYFKQPLVELEGLTLGVVGFGAIGARIAQLGQAFGMRVIAHTRSEKKAPGVTFVSKDQLLDESDVVSLHCPLTEQTKHWIDSAALKRMKSSALLINVSRGPVVDEAALAEALQAGDIAGAGLDVLSQEPPAQGHALCAEPRCIITPHIAWASTAARARLLDASVQNIAAYASGTPQNVVA